MTVTLYQLDKETYLWTKEELEELQKRDSSVFYFEPPFNSENKYEFELNGHKIKFIGGRMHPYQIRNEGFKVDELSEINVCILYGVVRDEELDVLFSEFEKYPNHKFVLIGKHTEDYWLSNSLMQSTELFDRVRSHPNVRVIWDMKLNQPSFHFHPKILFHNYHNQPNFQSGAIFEYASPLFKMLNPLHRIGFHINKRTTKLRKRIASYLEENPHPHLFFTSTDSFKSQIFDATITPTLASGNITTNWYLKQFLEMTVYSQMELVYETSTHDVSFPHLIKWNEKTIKLLFLGKPFIHLDMIAHSLMSNFGIKPYTSLYTPQLLEYYNSFSYSDNLRTEDSNYFSNSEYEKWLSLIKANIDWLLSLSDDEWSKRINKANIIAEENRLHIHNLIYNTSLLPLITSPQLFN